MKEAEDAHGNQSTAVDPKHASFKEGHRYGTKIGGGSVIDPAGLIHSASASHVKEKGGSLQDKLDAQRQLKAGAHAAFQKATGISLS